jgi:O-methyltransferase involved in polyketide biosynthesis
MLMFHFLFLITFFTSASSLVIRSINFKATNALIRSALDAVSAGALKRLDFNLRLEDESQLKNVASKLNVSGPMNAPKAIWRFAWKVQCFFLPILHFFDSCVTRDTCLNLAVLWWKAIAGDRVAYDFLPSFTRFVVGFPLRFLYPRLHHQNVLLRTKFLDNMLQKEIDTAYNLNVGSSSSSQRVAVINLGAGFDTRSIRFMNGVGGEPMEKYSTQVYKDRIDYFELDLPDVISQKRGLLERYAKRRRGSVLPSLLEADLNDLDMVRSALQGPIFSEDKDKPLVRYKCIIVMVEAVLMYVDKEKVAPLLKSVVDNAKMHSGSVSLVFSDRFPDVYEKIDKVNAGSDDELVSNTNSIGARDLCALERTLVRQFLHGVDSDLDLLEWLPKPGKARHQGVARVVPRETLGHDEEFPRLNIRHGL